MTKRKSRVKKPTTEVVLNLPDLPADGQLWSEFFAGESQPPTEDRSGADSEVKPTAPVVFTAKRKTR